MERIKGRPRSNLLKSLFKKYNGQCQICDKATMMVRTANELDYFVCDEFILNHEAVRIEIATIEHLIPLSHGGDYSDENLVLACIVCNIKRKNKMDLLWLYWVNDGAYYGTIVAKDIDSFKTKLEKLCSREGVKIETLGFREIKNANKSIFRKVNEVNKCRRLEYAQKMIGEEDITIEKLGTVDPTKDLSIVKYLPIPEYGICLVQKDN